MTLILSRAHKPLGAAAGTIWRQPTNWDRIKIALFGWYELRSRTFCADGIWESEGEYFPPQWWVWLRRWGRS